MNNDDTYGLYNWLPEAISDEAASHLVDCFHGLAYMMDSYYYNQVRRYNQAIDRDRRIAQHEINVASWNKKDPEEDDDPF